MEAPSLALNDPIKPTNLEAGSDDILFEAGDIKGRPLVLTAARMAVLWDRMNKFPILFATEKETTFKTFRDVLEDIDTFLIGFYTDERPREPVGIGIVYDVDHNVEAKFQISFFDQKLKGREDLIRSFVAWTFDTLLVRRVSASVRADARSMRAFLDRIGFCFEGVLKNRVQKGKRLYDLYLFALCEHECDEHWRSGRGWAKPRVKLLEVYETR